MMKIKIVYFLSLKKQTLQGHTLDLCLLESGWFAIPPQGAWVWGPRRVGQQGAIAWKMAEKYTQWDAQVLKKQLVLARQLVGTMGGSKGKRADESGSEP